MWPVLCIIIGIFEFIKNAHEQEQGNGGKNACKIAIPGYKTRCAATMAGISNGGETESCYQKSVSEQGKSFILVPIQAFEQGRVVLLRLAECILLDGFHVQIFLRPNFLCAAEKCPADRAAAMESSPAKTSAPQISENLRALPGP